LTIDHHIEKAGKLRFRVVNDVLIRANFVEVFTVRVAVFFVWAAFVVESLIVWAAVTGGCVGIWEGYVLITIDVIRGRCGKACHLEI
jgi:hypothetical protein